MGNLQQGQSSLTQEVLLHRIANRIRQSLELKEILTATVAEVRSFLGTDRVKVYQFNADSSGVVIAESLQLDRLPSLLGLNFPADDIPPYARELFVRVRQRSIVDLASQEIGLSPLDCSDGTPLETTDVRYRPVDPCHVEYLTAMGVKSSVVVPIVLESQETGKNLPLSVRSSTQLWGLLVSHHSEPRVVTAQELQFIQSVVDQVSLAISQSILLNQVREQARQEANINLVTTLLYTTPSVQLQEALEQTVAVLQGSGGRLYLRLAEEAANQSVELYTCGEQPALLDQGVGRPVEENLLWRKYLQSAVVTSGRRNQPDYSTKPWSVKWMRAIYSLSELPNEPTTDSNLWAISDVYKEPLFRALAPSFASTRIRGLLIVPLTYGSQIVGCLSIFRDEVDTAPMWAGCNDTDTRQLMPLQSFQAWRELKTGQALQWTEAEVKLAQALGERFSTAIKQYRLYQQVQLLNTNLEHQVRERTDELQQSNTELQWSTAELQRLVEQQQTMAGIVAKIRASLELDTIFKAVVAEVRQLLNVDRVAVFRFYPESGYESGEVVAEDVLPEYCCIVGRKVHDHCLGQKYAQKYRQGRVHAVEDIYKAGLDECYIQMLAQLQVRAYLIVPMIKGGDLWGLLCIHQCALPRHWQASETDFVIQIAAQLGVALQHAMLLDQTRHQTNQLSQALDHLKLTQTHLIHSEKMSSLGQLVAGIAHEINNPVNFIYGNLIHFNNYTENLLELVRLYQQHYPEPDEEIRQQADLADLEFISEDLPKLCSSLKVGADRIREIVLSLQNFSRHDQAKLKLVDIYEGLESTLLILQHRLKPSSSYPSIKVIKQYSELPLVECMAGQLNQVFMNLLANAIDALQERIDNLSDSESDKAPALITICTQFLPPEWVIISIKDNGIGMTEAVRNKLFDPFFTTKPVGKGTGLGLSISYHIIEKHGGSLQCLSQPGEGAEFIIKIPVKCSGLQT